MDLMRSFDAILFPADGRPPHVVSLMTSPASFSNPHTPAQTNAARVPHPEVHMEYITEDPDMRAWHYLIIEALDMMNKKFANPYIIYYPAISRDGMPFPVNRTVRDILEELNKGRCCCDDQLWRGNLVAAKFADSHFEEMMDASMADFPILKNFLATHSSPIRITTTAATAPASATATPAASAEIPSLDSLSPPAHAKCNYAEPAGSHLLGYEREPAASAHVVSVTAPSLCRDSRPAGTEQHVHPMEL
ncbi:hypothetical protein V8E53_000006 [Lactarius tabidus]